MAEREDTGRQARPTVFLDETEHPQTLHEVAQIMLTCQDRPLDDDEITLPHGIVPLVTVSGGVAEVLNGDVTIIDFDDWNDEDSPEHRQRMIERIQAAGYRCIVYGHPDGHPNLFIFTPNQNYSPFISDLPDSYEFAVYDPKGPVDLAALREREREREDVGMFMDGRARATLELIRVHADANPVSDDVLYDVMRAMTEARRLRRQYPNNAELQSVISQIEDWLTTE